MLTVGFSPSFSGEPWHGTKSLGRLSSLKETHNHVIVSGIESNGTNAVWTLASYISFKVRREKV